MRLYIVRHGQTEWNKLGRFQGQVNIPLNDLGRKQTRILEKELEELQNNVTYSSPLSRCYEMAEMICAPNHKIIKEPLIIEMAFGIYEGEDYRDRSAYKPGHPFYNFFNDPENYNPPSGGETFADLNNRAVKFLKKIEKLHPEDTILAFSHGAFIKTLIGVVKEADLKEKKNISNPNNCSVTVIASHRDKFIIEQENVDVLEGEKVIF